MNTNLLAHDPHRAKTQHPVAIFIVVLFLMYLIVLLNSAINIIVKILIFYS